MTAAARKRADKFLRICGNRKNALVWTTTALFRYEDEARATQKKVSMWLDELDRLHDEVERLRYENTKLRKRLKALIAAKEES